MSADAAAAYVLSGGVGGEIYCRGIVFALADVPV